MNPLILPLAFCIVIILFLLWRVSVLSKRVEQSEDAIERLINLNEELEVENTALTVRNAFLEPVRKLAHPHDFQHYSKRIHRG